MIIDLLVPDVVAALDFYASFFQADPSTENLPELNVFLAERTLVLRLSVDTNQKGPLHEKDAGPRLELRVPKMRPWLERAQAGGSKVPTYKDFDLVTYANIVDPFGYIWAFAIDKTPRSGERTIAGGRARCYRNWFRFWKNRITCCRR